MNGAAAGPRSPKALSLMVHDLLEPVLVEYVARLRPPVVDIVRHHFGWADEVTGNGSSTARHRLVPLVYLCSQLSGGVRTPWLSAAAAYTFMGNCALMYDDILDDDTVRRGRPTAWARFGVPLAMQSGASLLGLAYEILAEANTPAMVEAARRMSIVVRDGSAAQLKDVELDRTSEVTLDEVMGIVSAKTGAIVGLACTFGALAAGAPADVVDEITRFGHSLGIVFQLVDDMDELWGDPREHGQRMYHDLRLRKKIPLVVAALATKTEEAAELRRLLGRPDRLTDEEAGYCSRLIEMCGGREWARAEVRKHLAIAEDVLTKAVPDRVLRAELNGYAHVLGIATSGWVRAA